jgi:ATP-dependent Clp protease protease subunit
MRPPRGPFARSAGPTPLRIVHNAGSDTADVFIHDEIGPWYGVEAKTFIADLKAITAKTIHVRVNSPGGSVFDAVAIANALREHSATVIAHVDALAASAASFLIMAADEVRMADNAFLMIHDPFTGAMGNADDFRKLADTLDKVGEMIVNEYVKKSGATPEDVRQWMHDETWMTAEEALGVGFIDAIDGASSVANTLSNTFDLSIFAHAPAELLTRGDRSAHPKRDVERVLRDAGFSRSEAKAIAARAPKAPNEAPNARQQRDADDAAADVTSSLRSLHERLRALAPTS